MPKKRETIHCTRSHLQRKHSICLIWLTSLTGHERWLTHHHIRMCVLYTHAALLAAATLPPRFTGLNHGSSVTQRCSRTGMKPERLNEDQTEQRKMRKEQNYSQQLPLPWIDGGNMPDEQSFFESRCLLIVVGNVFKAEAETPRKKKHTREEKCASARSGDTTAGVHLNKCFN